MREALSNIEKHSNASHARVIVDYVCGYYLFMVEDNGVGTFAPAEGHYGLGTCVQFYFPEPEASWRMLNE